MIPHFEKMLYDNGPLLWLNAQACRITGDAQLFEAAIETGEWVMRDMQSAEGGYFSALDADSEGVEGLFYTWQPAAVRQILGDSDYPLFAARFGLEREANFEGAWHLHAWQDYTALAEQFGLDPHSVQQRLHEMRKKLFSVREQRIHPGLDDKILTSWNGLMIEGMATAGSLLQRDDFINSATRAADFAHSTLWKNDRLCATSKNGKTHLNAYLDDYAFLLSGLIALLQARWNSEHFNWACEIADTLITRFEAQEGGFYFTSHDHEQLILRNKSFADDAMPSGNGIAARSLIQLGYLSGETRYLEAAERCLKAGWQSLSQHPVSHCSLLEALQDFLTPPEIIILRGEQAELSQWRASSAQNYLPSTLVFAIDNQQNPGGALLDKKPLGSACAYICEGMVCQPPLLELASYQQHIKQRCHSI